MAKTFPKKLYITRIVDADDPTDVDYFVDETAQEVAERDDVDTEVAVYQLVKTGRVVKTSRVVFE